MAPQWPLGPGRSAGIESTPVPQPSISVARLLVCGGCTACRTIPRAFGCNCPPQKVTLQEIHKYRGPGRTSDSICYNVANNILGPSVCNFISSTFWNWQVAVVPIVLENLLTLLVTVNPLNAELNPICYLLALLGAHNFLHVSRIRDKPLTLRLLMTHIYIYIYIYIYRAPILDVSRSHTTTHHSR